MSTLVRGSTTVESSGPRRGSPHITECDRAPVCSHLPLTLWVFRKLRSGCGLGRSWSSVLHRVTPLSSSPYLCFPCKVWGFSKQTGGDKHMLWTALCWVVSEVQQTRSLSGCGYTSHSGANSRTGALLLPHW